MHYGQGPGARPLRKESPPHAYVIMSAQCVLEGVLVSCASVRKLRSSRPKDPLQDLCGSLCSSIGFMAWSVRELPFAEVFEFQPHLRLLEDECVKEHARMHREDRGDCHHGDAR